MTTRLTTRQKNRLKKKAVKWGLAVLRAVFIGGLCFVVLYPLLTLVTSSVMSVSDIYDSASALFPRPLRLSITATRPSCSAIRRPCGTRC